MDPRMAKMWRNHPQNKFMPQPNCYPLQQAPYSHVPLGPSLSGVITSNEMTPSFADQYPTIDKIQHLLASNYYQDYFTYASDLLIADDMARFYHESQSFMHAQRRVIEDDEPLVTAYEAEIAAFESLLTSKKPTTPSPHTHDPHKAHLLQLMRSRAALLRQDLSLRRALFNLEINISRAGTQHVDPLQRRVKHSLMVTTGWVNDYPMRRDAHAALRDLLPMDTLRAEKRGELERCRELRRGVEKTIAEVKRRVKKVEAEEVRVWSEGFGRKGKEKAQIGVLHG